MFKRILTFGISTLSCLAISPVYSLTLGDTIAATISKNPDILTTVKDHYAITEALQQSKAPFLPQVKINFGYGPDKNVNSNTIGTATPTPTMPRREEGVTINQMIFDGFATKNDVARNTARVNSAVYKVIASIQDNVQRNVEVYLGVLREEELVFLAQQNLDFHEKIARMIKLRTERGVSREADSFQAEARLSLAKANVLAEFSNLADAKANFYRTVGMPPDSLAPPPQPDPRYVPKTQQQALDIAMRNNPVVRSASADIVAAIEQHNVAKAVNFPRLDLVMGVSRDRNIGGVRGPSYDQYAVVRMTYDLFNGGADISRQRETAYQEQEAKEIKLHAIRQLIESIKLTWDLYITARAQIPQLDVHVQSAAKTVRAYTEQYQIGQRTLLDLLDGQNELFGAKRALITGRYDTLQATYRILRDMGISIVALHLENDINEHAYTDAAQDIDLRPEQTTYDRSHYGLSIVEAKRHGYSDHVYEMNESRASVGGVGLLPQPLPEYKPITAPPSPLPAAPSKSVLPIVPQPKVDSKSNTIAVPVHENKPAEAVAPVANVNSKPNVTVVPVKEKKPAQPVAPRAEADLKSNMAVALQRPVASANPAGIKTMDNMVQVGCFKSRQNAERLIAKLRLEHYTVTTREVSSAEGVLVHVYTSHTQSASAQPQLQSRPQPKLLLRKPEPQDELLLALLKRNMPEKPAVAPPHAVIAAKTSLSKVNVAAVKIIDQSVAKPAGWVIQVGCFKSKEKVKLLVDKLRAANFPVVTKEVASLHGVLIHVYVGPQMQLSSAKLLVNQLKQRVQLQGYPVQA